MLLSECPENVAYLTRMRGVSGEWPRYHKGGIVYTASMEGSLLSHAQHTDPRDYIIIKKLFREDGDE